MSTDPETIGDFCSYHPLALPLLRRAGVVLDPARSLDAACLAGSVDPVALRAEVHAAEERLTSPWRGHPVVEVIDHILRSYHRPLLRELSDVVAQLANERTHAWTELRRALDDLRTDMAEHLTIEEHVLFPWLCTPASTATAPIRAMQLEHADTIRLLLSLEIPAQPEALAARVVAIESWLCEHLHLESNELVPRALETETTRG